MQNTLQSRGSLDRGLAEAIVVGWNLDATGHVFRIGGYRHLFTTLYYPYNTYRVDPVVKMEYVQQVANIANVQNYATSLRETRLGSLKHPGEFFDWQRVSQVARPSRPSMLGADE